MVTVACALAVVACGGNDGEDGGDATAPTDPTSVPVTAAPTTAPPPTDTAPPSTTVRSTVATTPPSTTTPPPFVTPTHTRIVVTGDEEMVFDWTDDRCEDESIPDIAARAFRSSDGLVHLTIGHWNTYRMSGPTLDEVVSDCSAPILTSPFDPDPAAFADSWWIGSPYTADGQTVYAVVHNEYRGDTHATARPDQCESGERLPCLDTSFVMVVSTDGGRTFAPVAAPPGHMIATLPYTYRDDTVPSGIRQPSNVVRHSDGFYYLFGNVSDQPAEVQWVCAMRTDDLANPAAWRYWDGAGFTGEWLDPYTEAATAGDKCAPLADAELAGSVQESVVYDEVLGGYVMVGISADTVSYEDEWGVYYATSSNLVDWTLRELLIELPSGGAVDDPDRDSYYAYPAIIDPDSADMSFGTSDGQMYLYISRFNAGGGSLDRDLVRYPIAVIEEEIPAPAWTFDTDGDTEGWFADNDLDPFEAVDGVLRMESTGDDPWFLSDEIVVPSAYDRLIIRMRVEDADGQYAQVFWTTTDDGAEDEAKSTTFELRSVDEFRDLVIDLGAIPTWDGTIRSLRIDPLESSGRLIEIDSITFSHS